MRFKHLLAVTLATAFSFTAMTAMAQDSMSSMKKDPNVGGSPMYSNKNIVENAANSKDHTTLVAAVKAADLADTLSGPGPFTVFAPTNEAFKALPAGTVDNLLKPENKDQLKKVLTYHVVPGTMDAKAIKKAIKEGKGKATLTTVEGGHADHNDEGRQAHAGRRKGRHGYCHHRGRLPVERRDPCDQRRAASQLSVVALLHWSPAFF